MNILYFDCFSGISGDMVIGALIDAGGDSTHLVNELKKLTMEDEYELTFTKVVKNGITSTKFDVLLTNKEHSHEHEHNHDHEHHHGHSHRSYKHIVEIIKTAGFSERVEEMSLAIFKKIGIAEGKIHGVDLDDVHFHEVGAVDSIIDIIGAVILLDQLEIDKIQSSPIPVGSGKIHIDHGIYPVPAPATLEILRGIPIAASDVKGELATPTGAAIVAVLSEAFGTLPSMKVKSIGYGAGTKTFPTHPNVLRVIIGN
ncbi:nickel pincer cofactor biosynthesis protein LarC [Sporosarcina sp. Marseille-Q4063]|uniref:nickel pincer cofactor biosynthesis protein LarC n=1 Tax=Sporosarcina sp. Marseille-Q4063 TaxID=2810514 RepID=UPI001BB0CBF1|nr:nickel pincer cofactor biosynthesis protein LarC [Sporosarcina sp. Marseille-Q4063]QUW21551.1 nickel pincer cofactor biosynthesis protein LarC [Sporosarcina sp. Marseille-Q4063]